MIIKKPHQPDITRICQDMAKWLKSRQIRVFCEPNAADEIPAAEPVSLWSPSDLWSTPTTLGDVIDLVVTLGGDGTMLHANSLFPGRVPPVVAFAMGSVGFLTEHLIQNFQQTLERALDGSIGMIDRHRLRCEIHYGGRTAVPSEIPAVIQTMNEVSLVRGSPDTMLVSLNVSINGHSVSSATGDGVIVSTSTGSTAYSLSCGGPMIHPRLDCMLITPICPRSLSFRPVVLPGNTNIELSLASNHRNPAHIVASFDGRGSRLISANDYVRTSLSEFPIPTIAGTPIHSWIEASKDLLKWNVAPAQLR